MSANHRVFVVDSHPLFRKGVVDVIQRAGCMEVAGEARNAPEALGALRSVKADAVVLEIALQGSNGLELIKHLRAEHPALKSLVLSDYDEETYALRSLRAGALGYVSKREPADTVATALRAVTAGRIYVSKAIAQNLVFRSVQAVKGVGASPLAGLTGREREVLALIGECLSSIEIAGRLALSVKTVESHRLHIRDKLEFRNSTELVRFALGLREEQLAVLRAEQPELSAVA